MHTNNQEKQNIHVLLRLTSLFLSVGSKRPHKYMCINKHTYLLEVLILN